MDNGNDFVYFVNSQGKRAVLSSPENRNYWELIGRKGFTAPEVQIFTEKFATGRVGYFGKAVQPRTCSMNMVCVGDSTVERDKVFFEMVSILLDAEGTGEGQLFVRRSDGSMVHLNCVYSGGMNIVEEYRKLHLFTIEFYAADPYFYGKETEYDVSSLVDLPAESQNITIKNGTKRNQIARIQTGVGYSGSAFIQFYGGYIENNTTGKKITLQHDEQNPQSAWIIRGNYLSVDFNPGRIEAKAWDDDGTIRDGSSSINWPNTDSDFVIVPGDNLIDFSTVTKIQYSAFRLNGKFCVRSRYESA